MPDDCPHDVFISYCRHDEAWVCGTLLPRIEGGGLKAFIDVRDSRPGEQLVTECEAAW